MADDTTAAAGPSSAPTKPPLYKNLFFQVLVGIPAGVLVGALLPAFGERLSPLGEGFIKLIKMIIAPLIFCVVVTGIAKVGDMKAVGRIGLKALVYSPSSPRSPFPLTAVSDMPGSTITESTPSGASS